MHGLAQLAGILIGAASPPAALPLPPDLIATFHAADTALLAAAACPARLRGRGGDSQLERLLDRRDRLGWKSAAVWGPEGAGRKDELYPPSPPRCRQGQWAGILARARSALDLTEQALDEALAPLARGVWLGPLRLCAETVTDVTRDVRQDADEPMITLHLSRASGEALGIITGQAIGHPLAWRIDGQVIAQPQVNEAILGGKIGFSGPPVVQLDTLGAAVRRPCTPEIEP